MGFRCRSDDVFVCTYPRCGTTWMVQVVVCILFGIEVDYNMHAVFLEGQIATNAADLQSIEAMPDPRIMKTHAPSYVFPGLMRGSDAELQSEGRIIIVVRNPKDVLVSLRHHHENNQAIDWNGSWDEWIDDWLEGNRSKEYGGSYFAHVRGWWQLRKRHPSRIHLVYYEDMKANFCGVVADIGRFLGREISAGDLQRIEKWCSFDTMKSKYKVDDHMLPTINPRHFRTGEIGGWRGVLSGDQARKVDEMTWRELGDELADGLRIYDLEPRQTEVPKK